MIQLVEALNFRCLRYIQRPLERLQILVGPNASGKTTFLDVISFLGDIVTSGIEDAFRNRTQNPLDLFWSRQAGTTMELAVEGTIPEQLRDRLKDRKYDTIRYELAIACEADTYEPLIRAERALFRIKKKNPPVQRTLFPRPVEPPDSTMLGKRAGTRFVLNKVPGGNDNFYSEVYQESGKGWAPSYKLGPHRSTLGTLPADESNFPVATWLRDLLAQGVQRIILNSLLLRQASPPGQARAFRPDGSNLPWVIQELRQKHVVLYEDWLAHVRTALPDVEDVRIVVRGDDKHAYLVVRYSDGLEAPSWVVSDGTLRLLALTILAYIPDFTGIYLIEEPENGIHPTAVETVYQSLSSLYSGQVLVASHSPVLLSIARPDQLLCFARDSEGATDIVGGDAHPALQEWRGEIPLGSFFASGILG